MLRSLYTLIAFALVSFTWGGAHAQDRPTLEYPADCRIGEECWILSFVDLDSGPAYTDHHCGVRTYDAHKGTDIALVDAHRPDQAAAVRAAAAGVVVGVRDGVPDNELGGDSAGQQGQECGNGVRIDHGGGWFTQYCHMKQGSIQAKPKQAVKTGEMLGLIGNSGRSETPHLHFQLSRGADIVDPFTGRSQTDSASCDPGTPLWSQSALEKFGPYQPTHIRHTGFAVTVPTLHSVQKTPQPPELPGNRSALVFYAVIYGLPEGSTIRFTVVKPDGSALVNTSQTVPRNKARQFQYAGKKTPEGGWPQAVYNGEISVTLPPPYDPTPITSRAAVTLK